MENTPARKHYHDIDAARSVLMFLSVALHAGTVYAPIRPWITTNTDRHEFFDWLILGFHLLVTPTFFFVGGFFAVLMLSRRTFSGFVWNRFLRTVVPLIAIALTMNMVEHYLRWVDASGSSGLANWVASGEFARIWATGEWQLHLWFLVSLVPMFLIAAVIHAVLPKDSTVRRAAVGFAERLGQVLAKGWVFVIFVLALALANTANFAFFSEVPGGYDLIFPGFQSPYKLTSEFPFFVLGVLAALSPGLLGNIQKWRGWMPFAAAGLFIIQPYSSPDQSFLQSIGMLYANQLAIWVLVLFILQFFHRYFAQSGPRIRWFADCALSMYLLHHCFVYIYGRMLVPLNWPIAVEFALLTVAAAGTVIVLHEVVVRRVPLFRLLFNGKTDVAKVRSMPGFLESFGLTRPKPAPMPEAART